MSRSEQHKAPCLAQATAGKRAKVPDEQNLKRSTVLYLVPDCLKHGIPTGAPFDAPTHALSGRTLRPAFGSDYATFS